MSNVYGQTLLDDMVQQQGLAMPLVREAAKEILAVIRSGLIKDGVVNVSNFGTFRLKPVAARNGFNPQTREPIIIPAHQRVIFSPCKALRELIQPVHTPPVPITEPTQRAAARSAPIAEPIATKTIVPPAPIEEKKPKLEGPKSIVESRLESITQPEMQPEPLERQLEQAAEQIDELNDSAEIELQAGEEEQQKSGHGKYFYLGAAAIVIAAVSLSIYFGSSTDELPAPSAPVAKIEQPAAPVVVEPATVEPKPVSEPEPKGDEIDYSTLYTEMAKATPEVEPAQPVEQAVTAEAPVTEEIEQVAAQPLKAELPTVTPAAKPTTFFFTEKQYTIASGESLWRLARRHYTDPLLWPHIYQANAAIISNPDSLRAGRNIVIPSLQGSPDKLTKTDRRNIAEGYYLTYLHYKKVGHKDAFFALLEAKRYDNKVVEEHRSELQLNKVEEIMLSQQETMPFYSDSVPL